MSFSRRIMSSRASSVPPLRPCQPRTTRPASLSQRASGPVLPALSVPPLQPTFHPPQPSQRRNSELRGGWRQRPLQSRCRRAPYASHGLLLLLPRCRSIWSLHCRPLQPTSHLPRIKKRGAAGLASDRALRLRTDRGIGEHPAPETGEIEPGELLGPRERTSLAISTMISTGTTSGRTPLAG